MQKPLLYRPPSEISKDLTSEISKNSPNEISDLPPKGDQVVAVPPLIARQLRYMRRQVMKRNYVFQLINGERIVGVVERLTLADVYVRTEHGLHLIAQHDIVKITNEQKKR